MKKYVIALDQGTTSSRAIIFNKNQDIVGVAQKRIYQTYPQKGWVEANPLDIWATQYSVLQEVVAKNNISFNEIASIGITNQRETTIIWNKHTGIPIYNAIVWQCRRTSEICDNISIEDKKYIKDNTGLIVDAYFSATKIKWILDNVYGAYEMARNGDLLFGTVDTWLIWKLTNGNSHITDYTNASRTMLYNIKTLDWDKNILEMFNIPEQLLPTVKNSSEVIDFAEIDTFKIPISGVAGDQQASLFGQKCFNAGEAKNTYGTGCFLLMNTGNKIYNSTNGLLTTIGIGINNKIDYALEGSIFTAGSLIQWLKEDLKMLEDEKESSHLANSIPDTNGVYLVPALTGMGAPYWDMHAKGSILGLSRDTNNIHIIRAALESIAYQTKDLIEAIKSDTSIDLTVLKVDGGASNNEFLLQFQSDILNTPVEKAFVSESTALGAALLSGIAVGFWDINDLKESKSTTFKPQFDEIKINNCYTGWKKAINLTINID